jgi:hypothetical protein
MKFTTPAMASGPYTAEAPPVMTSTFSMAAAGIVLMSMASVASDGCQHQVTIRPETTQVQCCRARVAGRAALNAGSELRVDGHELRHLVEDSLGTGLRGLLERVLGHRDDRAGSRKVAAALNARPGDYDFLDCVVFLIGGNCALR